MRTLRERNCDGLERAGIEGIEERWPGLLVELGDGKRDVELSGVDN